MQLLKDGQIVESGVLSLGDAAPNKDIEVTIPYKTALDAGSEYFLNLSARLKKRLQLGECRARSSSEQYSLTGKIAVAPVDTAFNDTLKVEEEKGQIGFRAPGFFIAFNPETGKMVSLRYAGTDMIYNKEGFDFNWFRAMDNDKRDYLPTTVKKQAFDWKQATDKSRWSSLVMRETGLEPVRHTTHAPQTCLSANSSTLAKQRVLLYQMFVLMSTVKLQKIIKIYLSII